MTLLTQLQTIDLSTISTVMVSTTAKNNGENRLLPAHYIGGRHTLNLILNDAEMAFSCLNYLSKLIELFFIDVERKQIIDLWGIAIKAIDPVKLIPYKPNDMTRDAAYFYLNQYFNKQLCNKSIVIYGSGNIAVKLALCLAEQNARVSLYGRNSQKINHLITSLNSILPEHTPNRLSKFNEKLAYDCLITVLSAEHIVDVNWLDYLNPNALVLDIGINNLTAKFINQAEKKSIKLLRLDVRIASPMLEAMVSIHQSSQLDNAGKIFINQVACVAGGVIGQQGNVILNSILKPTSIVGIANGTGGVKNHEQYTPEDSNNIEIVKAYL